MISLDVSCNVVPHTLFQKLNIILLLAKLQEEIYWVNDNITDENSTHILKKIELHNLVHIKLSCEASKRGKGLGSHLVHFHFRDKKTEVLGGSCSKASFPPKTRKQLSWLPCLNTSPLS